MVDLKQLKGPTPMTLPVPPSPAVVIVPAETEAPACAGSEPLNAYGLAERIRQFPDGVARTCAVRGVGSDCYCIIVATKTRRLGRLAPPIRAD
jgi:hypothetical protein